MKKLHGKKVMLRWLFQPLILFWSLACQEGKNTIEVAHSKGVSHNQALDIAHSALVKKGYDPSSYELTAMPVENRWIVSCDNPRKATIRGGEGHMFVRITSDGKAALFLGR